MINNKDLQPIIERYNKRLENFGYSQKSVGWGEKGRQELRYEVLASYFNLQNKSLLDLGAGFGDGVKIFYKHGLKRYIGLEINKKFIGIGKDIYGKKYNNCIFSLKYSDISKSKEYTPSDLIVGSGIFNSKFKKTNNYQFIEQTIKKSIKACKIGIAFNFIDDQTDFKEDYIFYANIGKIVKIIQKYSKKYSIKKDYFPFEFSVFVHKDDSFNKKTSIFKQPRYK